MSDRKSSPEGTIQSGWIAIIVSIVLIIFKNFEWSTSCLFVGIVLLLLGYWRLRYNDNIPDFILIFVGVGGLFLSIFISLEVASYMNKQAAKQKICGVVENIRIVQGRGVSTFDLVGDGVRKKFLYYKHKDMLKTASSFCIEYAFDQRWSDYPYVFEIYPQKFNHSGKGL
ncbi:hypothetical protein [Acinetobacter venetianus]|uniref:hypothetical protein n=1 Tax=Acinetobacter venetianus TaxID=52133 RepID=UPI0003763138|nr:hypothetical protein [Acinetobacter venetianus]